MYVSLLEYEKPKEEVSSFRLPFYFTDLNIDQLLSVLRMRSRDYEIKSFYLQYPKDFKTVLYRQRIFKELKDKNLKNIFIHFSDACKSAKSLTERKGKSTYEPQRRMLFYNSVASYLKGVTNLSKELQAISPESEGLKALLSYMQEIEKQEAFQSAYKEMEEIDRLISGLNFNLIMTNDTIRLSAGRTAPYYAKKLKRLFPEQFLYGKPEKLSEDEEENEITEETLNSLNSREEVEEYQFRSPFAAKDTVSNLEAEIVEVYRKFQPDLFRHLGSFSKKYKFLIEDECFRIDQEAWFYFSYLDVVNEMERYGFSFCMPEVTEKGRLSVTEGYDIVLAWKNMKLQKEVVANSLSYEEGEKFFVLTGPNQGGKTTFARSLGQLVYFSMMGLMVPAQAAKLPFFEGLLTHFSVEESLESGRGKLKEELIRLTPMMHDKKQNQFVILNELFTTAATYDAYIMGDRVVKHFMNQGCVGIYVTHIPELAADTNGVISLVALADAEDHRRRTFRVARKPAERTGYAGDIVEKHGLSYDSLKKRVSARLGGEKL